MPYHVLVLKKQPQATRVAIEVRLGYDRKKYPLQSLDWLPLIYVVYAGVMEQTGRPNPSHCRSK